MVNDIIHKGRRYEKQHSEHDRKIDSNIDNNIDDNIDIIFRENNI